MKTFKLKKPVPEYCKHCIHLLFNVTTGEGTCGLYPDSCKRKINKVKLFG